MHNSTALNKSLVFIDSQVLVNHVHLLVNGKNSCQILTFIDSQVANADKPNESVAPGVEVCSSTQHKIRSRQLLKRLPNTPLFPVSTSFHTEKP